MKKMTFLDIAKEVLESADMPLTPTQIWKEACKKGLDKNSTGKTPAKTMSSSLFDNVKKTDSYFMKALTDPTTFWLKSRANELSTQPFSAASQKENKNNDHREESLHPLAVRFIKDKFGAYSKTIKHEKSKKGKKGEYEWIHPDIVAIYFPFSDCDNQKETLNLARNFNLREYKIYSFELKVELSSSSELKKCYFQAVANSRFANEGYLVVFEEITDIKLLNELKRLRDRFGIGVIQLRLDIAESEIILPSAERELDLQTINELIEINPDFKGFIENLNKDIDIYNKIHDNNRIGIDKYDKILDDEALAKHIDNNKITRKNI